MLAAYCRCFTVPFLFDDKPAITESNPTILHLLPPWEALSPPVENGQTVGGRPLPNLTLAINYAISGYAPWSYHALNLAVHAAAALLLFGIVRRTLIRLREAGARAGVAQNPDAVALLSALIWALHPLQTESVTYVVQRVESLMGLCYLATCYCFVRSLEGSAIGTWRACAFAFCLAGMACKEVMATAPMAVLLYDRCFAAGSFRSALKERGRFHAALWSTLALVAWLALGTRGRGGTAGFPLGGDWESHLLTQVFALIHYLRLAIWPYPLVFDYGYFQIHDPGAVAAQTTVLACMVGLAIWALIRRPAWGFLGGWYFLILAPSTLIPIPVQTMAEHRMYLSLAALAVGSSWAVFRYLGRYAIAVSVVLVCLLGAATYARNLDYQSEFTIWQTAAEHHPGGSARACFNFANMLAARGMKLQAREQLERAIWIEPRFAAAYDNLGSVELALGSAERAIRCYDRAIELDPKLLDPYLHEGALLEQLGRPGESEKRLRQALELEPNRDEARLELGNALFKQGRLDEALAQYRQAMGRAAANAEACNNAGTISFDRGDYPEAIRCYQNALRAGPDSSDTRVNLGNALALSGRLAEAAEQFQAALKLDPGDEQARVNLAKVRAALGR